MLMRVFGGYNRLLHAYPLITQCTTTGVLLAAGDVIAQKGVEKQEQWNWKRTAKFGAFGLLFIGPVIRNWLVFLERAFGETGKWTPIKKVLADQLCFNPVLQFTALPVLGVMNGETMAQIRANIEKNYVDIMIAAWKLWPFVALFNFYLVPLNYRLPVVALVSLVWNIYYTWKLGEKGEQKHN
ncbi:protein Mpv17-like [Oppia nitens]|uniref:protein Mpv17-like n=1 Tax=Oppia nitens TaxID=1686743 RepID=UPI0023DB1FA3|nr:protein Mpv17-like [Oppia nitens]